MSGTDKRYELKVNDIAIINKMMDILSKNNEDPDPKIVLDQSVWKSMFLLAVYLYRLTVTRLLLFVWNKLT